MTDAITRTVGDLRGDLPLLSWRYRRSVTEEIEHGLRDAQEAYISEGHRPAEAACRAVADFGDPTLVAEELSTDAGARAVRRLGAVQAVLMVGSVVLWAALGATGSGGSHQHGSAGTTLVYTLFVAVALPAVVVGLLAHRRMARPTISGRLVRRWGTLTAGADVATLVATQGTSMLKSRIVETPAEPGDAWLAVASNLMTFTLLGWAVLVLVTMRRLPTFAGPATH